MEESAQVGVLLAHGTPRGLDEGGLEPGRALANAGRATFSGALVASRTKACPRDQALGCWKARDVDADLADHDVSACFADARNRHEEPHAFTKGFEPFAQPPFQILDGFL